ncbi:MAG: HlyD family efflux transporter periplasmic adaptor subunit [Acidobacteria bacterium]|nr:HlyD family efflux transporter periplasmic adaptor subunit [Acidobacteriota bacterium]
MLLILASCSSKESNLYQGYIEGEFVYVSSPLSGTIEKLYVKKGDEVKQGDPLFVFESDLEKSSREEAEWKLKQTQKLLEDAEKGKRPTEIEALSAQLNEAKSAKELAEKEYMRLKNLSESGFVSQNELDRAMSAYQQSQEKVARMEAELKTARLGLRNDQIEAYQANKMAAEAVLKQKDWTLSKTRQESPKNGIVFDTLYREGEWVASGKPVVVILPPENIKVRTFVKETDLGKIKYGTEAKVFIDGVNDSVSGKVSFISPKAEFTPPVIYSKENRAKFVYMVEISFDNPSQLNLHPGQPVDVKFLK